jgi:hypothetical protein
VCKASAVVPAAKQDKCYREQREALAAERGKGSERVITWS